MTPTPYSTGASLEADQTEAAALLVYRLAAADVLRATRDLAVAARQLSRAAREWDPRGERQDGATCALLQSAEGMLTVAAAALPGMLENAAAKLAPMTKAEE